MCYRLSQSYLLHIIGIYNVPLKTLLYHFLFSLPNNKNVFDFREVNLYFLKRTNRISSCWIFFFFLQFHGFLDDWEENHLSNCLFYIFYAFEIFWRSIWVFFGQIIAWNCFHFHAYWLYGRGFFANVSFHFHGSHFEIKRWRKIRFCGGSSGKL